MQGSREIRVLLLIKAKSCYSTIGSTGEDTNSKSVVYMFNKEIDHCNEEQPKNMNLN